jgi:hypothetical protein
VAEELQVIGNREYKELIEKLNKLPKGFHVINNIEFIKISLSGTSIGHGYHENYTNFNIVLKDGSIHYIPDEINDHCYSLETLFPLAKIFNIKVYGWKWAWERYSPMDEDYAHGEYFTVNEEFNQNHLGHITNKLISKEFVEY